MSKFQSILVATAAALPVAFVFYVEIRRILKSRRRWFIKRASPDAPDMSGMVDAFATMGVAMKSFGIKPPKMPAIQEVFEEWYDAETGKWSPIQYGAVGFKTCEAAETVMASLILLDPKQIGKMEIVHV